MLVLHKNFLERRHILTLKKKTRSNDDFNNENAESSFIMVWHSIDSTVTLRWNVILSSFFSSLLI